MGGGGPGPPSLSTPSMAATHSDRLILSHALGTAEGGGPPPRLEHGCHRRFIDSRGLAGLRPSPPLKLRLCQDCLGPLSSTVLMSWSKTAGGQWETWVCLSWGQLVTLSSSRALPLGLLSSCETQPQGRGCLGVVEKTGTETILRER